MDYIKIAKQESVTIACLNRNVTNAINLQMLQELEQVFKQVEEDEQSLGLVLTSGNDNFFSMGFDIPEIYSFTKEEFTSFFKKFNRLCLQLYTLPKPTIAAINGHAVAGGCILAICFDYRFIADGRKLMGLNEIKLGVPLPYVCDRILENLVGYQNARDVADTGDFFEPKKLKHLKMIDQIYGEERLLQKSIKQVQRIGNASLKAFAMIKKNRTEPVVRQIMAQIEQREEFFVDCWYSPETRKKLKAAMEKF